MQYLKYKNGNWKTKDVTNKSGCITSFLKSKNINDSEYNKYFDLIDIEIDYYHCPLCNWKTKDLTNKSGIFTRHLLSEHNMSIESFINLNPDYKFNVCRQRKIHKNNYFELSSDNYIICKICNKRFKSITNTHLSNHNITPEEYKKIYNTNQIVSKSTSKILSTLYDYKNFKINKTSKEELSIRDYIQSIYTGELIFNSRKYTNGREVDIYVPDKNLAIEYAGLYYHSEKSTGKTHKYHLEQLNSCIDNDIRLILIFSDEWIYKTDIVKNKLKLLFNDTKSFKRLHGRKCDIKYITTKDKDEFLLNNHIQGTDNSKIKLGAYYDNELVAVMTFGKNRIALGNKVKDTDTFELVRYCVKSNIIIPGIASKLLNYFIKNNQVKTITTYSDRRWSDTTFYTKIGFNIQKITTPNYWYTKNYEYRMHRYNFTKQTIINKYVGNPSITEWENMKLLGYDRIWDCGNVRYSYQVN